MSAIEICTYLQRDRDQLGVPEDAWAAVTEQIGRHPDGPLATALRTPLLLGLATTALGGDRRTNTRLAACRDTTEIRDLLFAALIPAAIHRTRRVGRTRDYTEQKVQTWMHTLAQHLERRRVKGKAGSEITLDQIWDLRVLAIRVAQPHRDRIRSHGLLVLDEVLLGPERAAHELVDLGHLSLGFRRNYFAFSPIRRTPSPEPTTTTENVGSVWRV